MSERPETDRDFEDARATGLTLGEQLDRYAAYLKDRNPRVADSYQAFVGTLMGAEAGMNAPRKGDTLPPFVLPGDDGRLRSSAELLAEGPLIISFNRGNWCPFCWLELSALNDRYQEVRRSGGEVVSITPETATYSRRLKERLGLDFPVLTDLDNGYALELGLAIALPADVKALMRDADIDLGIYQKNDAWFVPIPATLLVGRDGVLHESYVNADFRCRNDPDRLPEILAALA